MQAKASTPTRSVATAAGAALAYGALFLWLLRGWLAVATDSVAATAPTGLADARLIVWVLDWVYHGLWSDWSLLIDAPINYPAPAQLTGSEHFGSSQLLYTPIRWATGNPILAANLTVMLSYPLTAMAMYAFLVAAGVAPLAAFTSGLLLALGPYQTPANLHVLQHLPTFLPLAALALLRLRQTPSPRRAALLALALLAGLISSYYTAFMLCAAIVPWALVEIGSAPVPRRRLATGAAGALLAAIAVLVLLSLPYLARAGGAARSPWSEWSWQAATILQRLAHYAFAGPDSLGVPLLAGAALGLLAVKAPDLRRYVAAALAVSAVGVFLVLGGTRLLASSDLPGVLGELASVAGRFFYIFPRGILLLSFAGSVLAGLGLEVVRRSAPGVGNAAAACLSIAMLISRGPTLGNPVLTEVDAFTQHRAAYRRIGAVIEKRGGGSLLELPRQPREKLNDSRAMMGQLIHRAPLITGHTGYQPPHRNAVDALIRQLPSQRALAELVRTRGLRWIVLRPQADWSTGQRDPFLRRLRAGGWIVEIHRADALVLVEVRDPTDRDVRDRAR
jgi:hypothetical protein